MCKPTTHAQAHTWSVSDSFTLPWISPREREWELERVWEWGRDRENACLRRTHYLSVSSAKMELAAVSRGANFHQHDSNQFSKMPNRFFYDCSSLEATLITHMFFVCTFPSQFCPFWSRSNHLTIFFLISHQLNWSFKPTSLQRLDWGITSSWHRGGAFNSKSFAHGF